MPDDMTSRDVITPEGDSALVEGNEEARTPGSETVEASQVVAGDLPATAPPEVSVGGRTSLDDVDLDDLDARLEAMGALDHSVREELTGDVPLVEGDEAPAEGNSLRSQLAEMFGVDVDALASSSEEPAIDPRTNDGTPGDDAESPGTFSRLDSAAVGPGVAAAEPDPVQVEPMSFLPPPEDPVVEGRGSEPDPPPASVAVEKPELPPVAVEPAEPGEESVADYMERLLARSRGTAPSSPEPAKPTSVPKTEKPPAEQTRRERDDAEMPAVVTPRDRRFRKPIDKEQLRREVSSLRELALQSSRAAVAKSQRREMQMQMQSKAVVTGVSLLVSIALIASPLWSRESFMLYGAAGLLITAGLCYHFAQSLDSYRSSMTANGGGESDQTDRKVEGAVDESAAVVD